MENHSSYSRVSKHDGRMPTFDNDDDGYLAWLAANQELFVLNVQRSAAPPTNIVLHRASCWTIDGTRDRSLSWTGPYFKVCGTEGELRNYVRREAGGPARNCGTCLS
jgi:hypothetical protein